MPTQVMDYINNIFAKDSGKERQPSGGGQTGFSNVRLVAYSDLRTGSKVIPGIKTA